MTSSNSSGSSRARTSRARAAVIGCIAVSGTALASLPASHAVAASDDAPASGGFDCLITPNALLALGVEVRGVVEYIAVDRGERVAKGQALATMKADLERATVAQARDRVAMDSEISAREADLEFARQVLARQKSLSMQELAPQQTVDEAKARALVAEAALRRARDDAALERNELLRQEALLAQRVVISPIDGVVVRRHAGLGELVVDGPLLTVADLDTLRVEAVLPAEWFGRIVPGDVGRVFPEMARDRTVTALVTAVDPMLDAASGTFGVRLSFDNVERPIVAGQECRVAFGDAPGS